MARTRVRTRMLSRLSVLLQPPSAVPTPRAGGTVMRDYAGQWAVSNLPTPLPSFQGSAGWPPPAAAPVVPGEPHGC